MFKSDGGYMAAEEKTGEYVVVWRGHGPEGGYHIEKNPPNNLAPSHFVEFGPDTYQNCSDWLAKGTKGNQP